MAPLSLMPSLPPFLLTNRAAGTSAPSRDKAVWTARAPAQSVSCRPSRRGALALCLPASWRPCAKAGFLGQHGRRAWPNHPAAPLPPPTHPGQAPCGSDPGVCVTIGTVDGCSSCTDVCAVGATCATTSAGFACQCGAGETPLLLAGGPLQAAAAPLLANRKVTPKLIPSWPSCCRPNYVRHQPGRVCDDRHSSGLQWLWRRVRCGRYLRRLGRRQMRVLRG